MNPGVLEEVAGAGRGVIDAMKGSPLMLAMGVMNLGLLLFLFYYMSRITSRTEVTVNALFQAQDKLYTQWGKIVSDTGDLAEKSLHCITVDDAMKLLNSRTGTPPINFPPIKLPPLKLLRDTIGG